MSEPELSISSNTFSLQFDPISEQMANWIVQSKTVYFGVVRNRAHRSRVRWRKNREQKGYDEHSQFSGEYFTYTWEYPPFNNGDYYSVSIPRLGKEREAIQVSELINGQISRNIPELYSWVSDYRLTNTIEYMGNWVDQFYIGLFYKDIHNKPVLFKMAPFTEPHVL